jgi:polysaccharide biosynthesis protein VpsM
MFKVVRIILIFLVALSAIPAMGQEQPDDLGLVGSLRSDFLYDDNILHQKEGGFGSRIWVLNPKLALTLKRPGTEMSASYDFVHNNYLDSSVDSFDRHALNLNLQKKLNSANKITLEGAYLSTFEQRGIGFNEGSNVLLLDAPTPLVTTALTASYQLGADTARLRMIGSGGKRSTDRDSPVIIDDSRDFRENLMGAQVLYRVGWRTDLVAEYRTRDIRYDRTPIGFDGNPVDLDSTEQQKLVGVDLRATAKTTGKARVGTIKRDFKWEAALWEDAPNPVPVSDPVPVQPIASGPRNSGNDLYWELSAIWAPRSYSTFTLNTQVATREALAVGNFIRSQEYSLLWTHRWNGWMQSEIDLSTARDTYVGSSRTDERHAINLRMLYTFNSWLNMGMGVRHQQLESNFSNLGFDKWVYYLYFNYSDHWGR